jgi:hypothetical protein
MKEFDKVLQKTIFMEDVTVQLFLIDTFAY